VQELPLCWKRKRERWSRLVGVSATGERGEGSVSEKKKKKRRCFDFSGRKVARGIAERKEVAGPPSAVERGSRQDP